MGYPGPAGDPAHGKDWDFLFGADLPPVVRLLNISASVHERFQTAPQTPCANRRGRGDDDGTVWV